MVAALHILLPKRGQVTMNVTMETQQPGKRVLLVEVEEDRVKRAIDEAYRYVSRTTMIPGFRRGKAPRNIIDLHVGKANVHERALEKLLSECCKEAIAETGVEPYEAPEVEIVDFEEGKPLKFRARVEVRPEAKLGQYKGLGITRQPVEVSAQAVTDELEKIRKAKAELVDLEEEGKVEPGKVAFVKFYTLSHDVLDEEADNRLTRSLEEVSPGGYLIRPLDQCGDLERQLMGARSGEERPVSIESVEALAAITAIKEPRLPDLDDEFARSLGPFENVEELKKSVENNLRHLAEEEASKKVREEILDRISEKASFEIPESLVERQLDSLVNSVRVVSARVLETRPDLDKTAVADVFSEEKIKEIRERYRPRVEQDIKRELVIRAVASEEGIEVDEDEMLDVLTKMAENRRKDPTTFITEMAKGHGLESVRAGILREKVLEFLMKENVVDEDRGAEVVQKGKESVEEEDKTRTTAREGDYAKPGSGPDEAPGRGLRSPQETV